MAKGVATFMHTLMVIFCDELPATGCKKFKPLSNLARQLCFWTRAWNMSPPALHNSISTDCPWALETPSYLFASRLVVHRILWSITVRPPWRPFLTLVFHFPMRVYQHFRCYHRCWEHQIGESPIVDEIRDDTPHVMLRSHVLQKVRTKHTLDLARRHLARELGTW